VIFVIKRFPAAFNAGKFEDYHPRFIRMGRRKCWTFTILFLPWNILTQVAAL